MILPNQSKGHIRLIADTKWSINSELRPSQTTSQGVYSMQINVIQDQVFPTQPSLEDTITITCDGLFSCSIVASVCDQVDGGLSTNPDGTITCTL